MSLLDNIRVLTRAVELGSFSAAGRNMRLSAGVVSHRIGTLERHLGCRLLNRTTRKMQLTEQGRVFYEIASTCLLRLIVRRRAWRTRAPNHAEL
jgi:DNA-binding transcriptional LysR family regulator